MRFSLLMVLLTTFVASGQIVNIESQRLSANKDGVSGNLDLNMNLTVNSKELFQVGTKLQLVYKKKRNYWLLLADQFFVHTDNESIINNGFEHVRYNFTFKDSGHIAFEAYQQGQFNEIQRINKRLLTGTGLRFLVVEQKKLELHFGTGFMGEYEEIIDGIGTYDVLFANYGSISVKLDNGINFNTITYFQPKLIDFGNYRLSHESAVRFQFSKHISFRIIYSLNHDSRSIEGVRKTNYTFKNAISFTF